MVALVDCPTTPAGNTTALARQRGRMALAHQREGRRGEEDGPWSNLAWRDPAWWQRELAHGPRATDPGNATGIHYMKKKKKKNVAACLSATLLAGFNVAQASRMRGSFIDANVRDAPGKKGGQDERPRGRGPWRVVDNFKRGGGLDKNRVGQKEPLRALEYSQITVHAPGEEEGGGGDESHAARGRGGKKAIPDNSDGDGGNTISGGGGATQTS